MPPKAAAGAGAKPGKKNEEEEAAAAAAAAAAAEAEAKAAARRAAAEAATRRPVPNLATVRLTPAMREAAERVFREADKDKSGVLDRAELGSALRALGLRLTEAMFERYVDRNALLADVDKDGVITVPEFTALYGAVVAPARYDGPDLRKAVGRGECDRIRELLRRGCDPNYGDGRGYTAAHFAADCDQPEALDTLVEVWGLEELDLDAPDNSGWTPLTIASCNGFEQLTRRLLALGADPGAQSTAGRTPLHAACEGDCPGIVPLLVGAGADVNARDAAGWTPLALACLHGSAGCVEALAAAGADLTATDDGGRPLDRLCHPDAALALRKARRRAGLPLTAPASAVAGALVADTRPVRP